MSNTKTIRNEVSQLAQQIENLARQVQTSLAAGNDPILLANELVRNSSTFTFALGELYALQESAKGTTKQVTVVSNPNNTKPRNYHNVRDSLGRFRRV